MTTKEIVAQRYGQRDLHELARVVGRWWHLLVAAEPLGLTDGEKAVMHACALVASHVRQDATDMYRIKAAAQTSFDEVFSDW